MKSRYLPIYFLLFVSFPLPSRAVVADINMIQKLKADALSVKEAELNDLEYKFEQARRKPLSRYLKKNSKRLELEDLQRQIGITNSEILRIDANDFNLIVPVFKPPFTVGQVGRLGNIILAHYFEFPYVHQQSLKVISIIDEGNVLTEFSVTEYFQDSPGPRESKTLVGHRVGRYIPVNKTIWLRGINTKDLITGSSIKPPLFLIITGTQDYYTPDNAKQTVFVFEPLVIP